MPKVHVQTKAFMMVQTATIAGIESESSLETLYQIDRWIDSASNYLGQQSTLVISA